MDVGVEGGLEGVDVDQVVVETEVDSGCLFLAFLGGEGAVQVLDALMQFTAGEGEGSHALRVLSAGVAVEEAV